MNLGRTKRRILVTGSRGTLGRYLVEELKARGHKVYQCDLMHSGEPDYQRADVGNYREIQKAIASVMPEYIYHLAAEFGRINGEENYEQVWQTNVIGTRHILELQKIYNFKLIFASSSEIYGDAYGDAPLYESITDIPQEGDWITHYPPIQGNDYAISKWVNEMQIMNFEKRHGNQVVRLRFFNAYGPGETYHPYRSVVCLFCHNALYDKPYTVYDGYHRVFMYVGDFIPTLANVCDNFRAGEVYNIGGNEYRSVRELSDIVLSSLGKDDRFVTYLPEDKHNVVNKRPDITKAMRDLGHNPSVTLEQGVPLTLEWMKSIA